MKCEKCQDVGFIEHNAGLLVEFCDCEAGKKAEAKQREILGYPETPPGPIMNERFQSGVKDDSDSGDKPDNQPSGSGDTSKPAQPKKPKAKRKARKRAG